MLSTNSRYHLLSMAWVTRVGSRAVSSQHGGALAAAGRAGGLALAAGALTGDVGGGGREHGGKLGSWWGLGLGQAAKYKGQDSHEWFNRVDE